MGNPKGTPSVGCVMLTLLQASSATAQTSGAAVAGPPVIGLQAPTDIAALQSQVRNLRVELSGLQAQWDGLYSQLNAMLKNNPARPGVQQTWADVGVQMARVKGEIAFREARISQIRGVSDGTTTSSDNFPGGRIPNVAFPAAAVLLMVLGLPVSIAWARRIFRGRPQSAQSAPDYTSRLENIERAIDTVAIEVERISEGQRFVTRILAGRPDRVVATDASGSPAYASPAPKALGAGPVEPISMPQRERVRQPIITPH
jgi:hypothetical protein